MKPNLTMPLAPDLSQYHHHPDFSGTNPGGTGDSSHFSHYFALMEKCRNDALEELLPNAERYLGQGFGLITEYARIDFANEQCLFDHVVVRMECLALSRTRMELGFEFIRESDGTVLCRGRNAIVWVNPQRHPAIMPEELYRNAARRAGLSEEGNAVETKSPPARWDADQRRPA